MKDEDFVTMHAFTEHAKNEELNQRATNDALHEGNIRMGNIEESIRPLQAIRNMMVGAGWVGSAVIVLASYIYLGDQKQSDDDRKALKSAIEVLQRHTVLIEKAVQSHEELEKDVTKEFQRIEKALDKVGKL